MINLLSKSQKSLLRKTYFQNLASIILVALIISLIIGGILLVPSYLFSELKVEQAEAELAQLTSTQGEYDQEQVARDIEDLEARISILQLYGGREAAHDIFSVVIDDEGSGILLEGMTLVRLEESSELKIDGIAAKRSDLRNFTRSLEADDLFEEVTFPVSNLAEETDINFNLTLEGNF